MAVLQAERVLQVAVTLVLPPETSLWPTQQRLRAQLQELVRRGVERELMALRLQLLQQRPLAPARAPALDLVQAL